MGIEILCQPHVPKPLHGLNPRTILGKEWWDKARIEAQKINNYKCFACGIDKHNAKYHNWLEGHEIWNINYKTGECKVIGIASLCHMCHNFIHSGRLKMVLGSYDFPLSKVKDILQHGFNLLKDSNLEVFMYTYFMAKELNINTYNVDFYINNDSEIDWKDYHLVIGKNKYYSKFENYKEWETFYNN